MALSSVLSESASIILFSARTAAANVDGLHEVLDDGDPFRHRAFPLLAGV